MSDDSDLLIAAAATAAVFTWVGTRGRGRRHGAARRDWRPLVREVRAGFLRSWREAPGYLLVTAIRDLFRKR